LAAVADSVKQRNADFVLELLDGLTDSRLGGKHLLGGLRKAALAHHLDKSTEEF
jgi:hypothetical protein